MLKLKWSNEGRDEEAIESIGTDGRRSYTIQVSLVQWLAMEENYIIRNVGI